MEDLLTLPYYAEESCLPARLPTMEEIASPTEVLQAGKWKHTVVGIGRHFVVKYGPEVRPIEGQTMIFLQQSTKLPIPRIYAIFQSPDKKITYLIMERIHGVSLEAEWPKMDSVAKDVISHKLQLVLGEMRELKSPGGYCSVDKQELQTPVLWLGPDAPNSGPFETEQEFNAALLKRYTQHMSKYRSNYFARMFKDYFQNHAPVFSHADYRRKNIMLRKAEAADTEETNSSYSDFEVVLIDFEKSGWYPSYWEYMYALFGCGAWKDDWSDWIEQQLEPFRVEYAVMNVFHEGL